MNSAHIRFFIALLTVGVFGIPTGALYAAPKAAETNASTAKVQDATVNLFCTYKSGNKLFTASGTGVLVDERGVILTNAHVAQYFLFAKELQDDKKIKPDCSVRTGSPAKDRYDAEVLYISPAWLSETAAASEPSASGKNDFALLYVTNATKGTLPQTLSALSFDALMPAVENTNVTIAGYPTDKLKGKDLQKKLKQVSAESTIANIRSFDALKQADVLTLGPSKANAKGVSGGPILAADGDIIAIATSKSTAKKDPELRAISLPYIDRLVRVETGVSLADLIAGDLSLRAATTASSISSDMIAEMAEDLFKKRK